MRFKKVYLEITNICNLSCSFCSVSSRKTGFISPASFSKVLDEIMPFTDYIYLHVKGEPLLHPHLKELLVDCHQRNCKVNLTTNGTLIGKTHHVLLTNPALRQVNFSLHSCEESIKQIPHKQYIDAILSFTREAIENTKMIISLRFWNWHAFNQKPSEMNRNLFNAIEEQFQLPYKLEDTVIAGQGLKIKEQLYVNSDFEFSWPTPTDEDANTDGFCYGMRDQVAILLDGTVVPCCLDGEGVIHLGNIYETPFKDIIESKRAIAIYNGFTNHKAVESLCIKCSYKDKFVKK